VSLAGASKDINVLVKAARKQGWDVRITGGNHIQFIPPERDLPIVHGALTGTGPGVVKLRTQLRRSGLRLKR
jgi:hypothetical protein